MRYSEALQWIHSIKRFGSKPGLSRISALLERLGNPHHRLRFIHIGGTNGKGSTAAFAASILEACGYRVGLYTSPYLEQFTNRIAVNGSDINFWHLVRLVERIKPLVEEIAATDLGQPTEFEVVTALALTYFAEMKPDFVVLEVGLGGRLDATNVVSPLLSVITTISLDHTQVLGDTLAKIAYEKAGIIKQGAPVITAVSSREALAILEQHSRESKVPLYRLSTDFFCSARSSSLKGQLFDYRGLFCSYKELFIPLLGEHQFANAALAVAVSELLREQGFKIPESSLRTGLKNTRWPGRLEIIKESPLVVIDGAHNIEAIKQLEHSVRNLFSYERLHLVLGILGDKAVEEILSIIVPLADRLIVTAPVNPRAAAPEEVKQLSLPFARGAVIVKQEIADACAYALKTACPADMVLVTGSLYTISEARKALLLMGEASQ
ncbi:MAG: bifunctional folylpolyglutamate synthase/dihydrofolate synthase [Dethiobacteria bacterium]|nr:bifunctional folylpolyglutamate synthase/dihydrofolate synthase [Bacillota bacterium]